MTFLKNKGSLGPAKLKKAITGAGLWVSSHRRWAFGGGVHAAVESWPDSHSNATSCAEAQSQKRSQGIDMTGTRKLVQGRAS
jgi:hypothetical protein